MINHLESHITGDEKADKSIRMSIRILEFELDELQSLELQCDANEMEDWEISHPDNHWSKTVGHYRSLSAFESTLSE